MPAAVTPISKINRMMVSWLIITKFLQSRIITMTSVIVEPSPESIVVRDAGNSLFLPEPQRALETSPAFHHSV